MNDKPKNFDEALVNEAKNIAKNIVPPNDFAKAWMEYVDRIRADYERYFIPPEGQESTAKNIFIVQRGAETDEVWEIKKMAIQSALMDGYNPTLLDRKDILKDGVEINKRAEIIEKNLMRDLSVGAVVIFFEPNDYDKYWQDFVNYEESQKSKPDFENTKMVYTKSPQIDWELTKAICSDAADKIAAMKPPKIQVGLNLSYPEKTLENYVTAFKKTEIIHILENIVCTCYPNREQQADSYKGRQ